MKISNELVRIRRRAVPVLRRYGVRRASVFGSYARGEQKKKSDVASRDTKNDESAWVGWA